MSKHTPGPWSISKGTPDIGIVTEKVLVAMVTEDEDSPCKDGEQLANARLIAAAPELLGALKALLVDVQDLRHFDTTAGNDLLADCRAAIAKAGG